MRALETVVASLAVALAAAVAPGCGEDPGSDEALATNSSEEALTVGRGLRLNLHPRLRLLTICVGEPVTIAGVVDSLGAGMGITIDTVDGLETVYGLGPVWYWFRNDMARPVVGDAVEVVVTEISTSEYPVILSITVNGDTLDLRDPVTCRPLW